MHKIAIKVINSPEVTYKYIALHLQRFILEGDYRISSICEQLLGQELIELDISIEENMPEFTSVIEEFFENKVEYQLYKKVDTIWEESELDEFNLDRTPFWLTLIIGITLLSYFIIGLIQTSAIYNIYNSKYEIYGLFSAIGAVVTAYIPLLGSMVAYNSAIELWNWHWYNALFIFFIYYLPLIAFIFYLIWIIFVALFSDRWYRFWYSEFN